MVQTRPSTSAAKPAAMSVANMFAMLACHTGSAQAFQSSFFATQPSLHLGLASSISPVSMHCSSPLDPFCFHGAMDPFRHRRAMFRRWPRSVRDPMVPTPPGSFEDYTLQVADPETHETDQEYKLTFELPEHVDPEDFEVAVSGPLLTVRAKVTREQSDATQGLGGWVSRSSRTDSVARSFVLPEGVSSSSIRTSKMDSGKIQVRFDKVTPDPEGERSEGGGSETATGDKAAVPSASASYLSGLSKRTESASPPGMSDLSDGSSADIAAPGATSHDEKTSVAAEERRRPRSVFDAVFDDDMSNFANLVWGEDPFRFPTEEEMAARAEKTREERAKRVASLRRSRMTARVSEEDSSYVVRMALPEGATRDDVTLTITPEKALRVTFSAEGRRSMSREIRLPRDAMVSEVSARFESEDTGEGVEGSVGAAEGVCGLEIRVGKVVPPEPKRIEIR